MAIALMPDTEDKATILARLFEWMESGKSTRSFAEASGLKEATLRRWCAADEFAAQYAHARQAQVHAMAEEIIDISDDLTIPPEHKRVMVDTRKWYASKVAPKAYGDDKHHTVDISVSGLHLTALQAAKVVPAQLTAGEEIVVEALPDDDPDAA